jgi:hypothetical protein
MSGIDNLSSAADVDEALRSLGAELHLEERDGHWQATVSTSSGGGESLLGDGDTRDEAARQAWDRFRARQGGTGAS